LIKTGLYDTFMLIGSVSVASYISVCMYYWENVNCQLTDIAITGDILADFTYM